MRESSEHRHLIDKGCKYICSKHPESTSVRIDEYAPLGTPKALYYLDHEPDIVVEGSDYLVIGEAKTSKDILTAHSKRQYDDYLKSGTYEKKEVYFYLFVPWDAYAGACNYLNKRCKTPGLNTVHCAVVSEVEMIDL